MKSLRIIGLSLIMFLSFITASAKQSDYIIIVNGLIVLQRTPCRHKKQ